MHEHFCTYFDHRYAAKGLALWRSLEAQCSTATLHVLCLSDASFEVLTRLRLPNVHLYPLKALEDADPELRLARVNRSLVEYYFTTTPCLPLYLLKKYPDIARITYLDADLFFVAAPDAIFVEIANRSVAVIEHRFPDDQRALERYGRFNVGWLTFRRDPTALQCLEVWREQCLEWCHDQPEAGRFAEQKYLDEWPSRFPNVAIIQHRGANVAPWNLRTFSISADADRLLIGGDPLIFFHAHGFVPSSPGRPRDTNLKDYGAAESPLLSRFIFEPYENAIIEAARDLGVPLTLALLSEPARHTALRLETLSGQLSASETERATGVEVIDSLKRQLAATQTDLTSRAETMRTLANRLAVIEIEMETARRHWQEAQSRVEDIEQSRSWRWTRPFRWAFGRLTGRRSSD
jgi:hypothetical protein